jgi:hypothetical protein
MRSAEKPEMLRGETYAYIYVFPVFCRMLGIVILAIVTSWLLICQAASPGLRGSSFVVSLEKLSPRTTGCKVFNNVDETICERAARFTCLPEEFHEPFCPPSYEIHAHWNQTSVAGYSYIMSNSARYTFKCVKHSLCVP